jgi:peptidoglycan/xylan/chitin deacetylase (PgdA/CDA1 family)
MSQSAIPILTYHSLDGSGSIVSVAPAVFRWQMAHLKSAGFRTLSLADVARFIHEGKPFPSRAFAITFDDGYENIYTDAFPVLQDHGFTATVFLITDYCGKMNTWPGHVSPVGDQPLLTWAQVAELQHYGIEFGSHTMTHPDLTQITPETVETEIRCSRESLCDRLGTEAAAFAYPYGKCAPWVIDMVRKYYAAACSTKLGIATPGADLYLLPRVDMYYLSGKILIRTLRTRGLDWYLRYRQALRATKHWLNDA